MAIHQQTLDSATVRHVRYDDETSELDITFASGKVYTYHGVTQSVYDGLTEASSPGSYFHQNIKGRFS